MHMWRDIVAALDPAATFLPPTNQDMIWAAEATVGQSLPAELAALLLESNGIEGPFGAGLIWPVERIAQDNRRMRHSPDLAERFMPFEALLFFADDGGSVQYAVVRHPCRDDIFAWDRTDDSRRWFAPRLEDYLRRCLRKGSAVGPLR